MLACVMALVAVPAFAQQRPLVTEDPEVVGAGRVLLEGGIDYGRDVLFPAEHHAALVAAYPGAEPPVFPELGHNLILERPHEVGPVLAAFLTADVRPRQSRNN